MKVYKPLFYRVGLLGIIIFNISLNFGAGLVSEFTSFSIKPHILHSFLSAASKTSVYASRRYCSHKNITSTIGDVDKNYSKINGFSGYVKDIHKFVNISYYQKKQSSDNKDVSQAVDKALLMLMETSDYELIAEQTGLSLYEIDLLTEILIK